MKKVWVCNFCGSPRLLQDAYVPLNDPDNVRLFDNIVCDDCGDKVRVSRVEVSDDFDIYEDTYTPPEKTQ